MTIDVKGPQASERAIVTAGTWGRTNSKVFSIELAALAQNKVAALGKLPFGSVVTDFRFNTDALGANTAIEFGFERVAAGTGTAAYFATAADTSTAANGRTAAFALKVDEDMYVTAKQTGAGTATGTVEVIVQYEYDGVK